MKQLNGVTNLNVRDLSREELENTYGGAWWEIRVEKDKLVIIFHLYDDDKPQ